MVQNVETELARLKREIEECLDCPLAENSPQVVFGEGNPLSPFTIVGEGPGEREEMEGRPFVGRAGQLLDRVMAAVSLSRDEVWITNVLKRRASEIVNGRVKNRLPRANELAAYKELLDRELKIISPMIVLCLGNLAANVLIHRGFRMTREHGQWFSGLYGRRLMATFHPAYILRLEGDAYDEVLSQTIQDFSSVTEEYRSLPKTMGNTQPPAEESQPQVVSPRARR